MTTVVQNSLKDRSKTLRCIGDGLYEFGWEVVNRRARAKSYFNKMGEGTLEEAQAWMEQTIHETKRSCFHQNGSSH